MAHNGMGEGAYSSELTITTDNIPAQGRNLATVSVAPKSIELSWDAFSLDADTGRDDISYYKLEYLDN
jgi:hypothetical protein